MPFAQFFDPAGIAMHAGYNPGVPASHGCVRLPTAFAKKLYTVTEVGTPVYVGA
jgi:lipoprotein-anchoring transpeptidase ErfK/SrfK